MSDLYVASLASASVTAAGVMMEILNPGSARMKLSELEIFWASGASTSIQFGIGRPGNTPTTGTQVTGTQEDPAAPAPAGATAIAGWGVAPTIPAKFIRQAAIASAGGNGVIWTLPKGEEIVVPPSDRSKSIVLWCTAIGSAVATVLTVTTRWAE